MPSKKTANKQSQSPDSSDAKNSRRSRLFALFGAGVEEFGNVAPLAATSHNSMASDNASIASSEKSGQPSKIPSDSKQTQGKSEMSQDPGSASGNEHAATDNQEGVKPSTPSSIRAIGSNCESSVKEENRVTPDRPEAGHAVGASAHSPDATPTRVTPGRSTRLPIHRHKRAETAVKIIDKESADAVLLHPSTYASPAKNTFRILPTMEDGNTVVKSQPKPSAQPQTFSEKPKEVTPILSPSSYAMPSCSHNVETPKREGSLLSPNSYTTPAGSKDAKKPENGASLLSSTSYTTSSATNDPSHGVLKGPGDDKKHTDKKVRFAMTTSADGDADDEGDSDDSDKTIKAGVGGMKAAIHPALSPVIWDKGSEPKIWIKDGKPTLFQPKKEPGYYTNPLWSRQYPEILSDDPKVNPYAADYASSTASQVGSEASETAEAKLKADFGDEPRETENRRFKRTPQVSMPSPTTAAAQFIPVIPPTPSGFTYPPCYRNRVVLEMGGRRFVSSMDVLARSAWFRHIFAIPFMEWYRDGILHIDNDPDLFAHILRFLRTGDYPLFWDSRNGFDYAMYSMVQQQARYYLIPQLENWIAEQRFLNVVDVRVRHRKLDVGTDQVWYSSRRLRGFDSYVVSGTVGHTGQDRTRIGSGEESLEGYGEEYGAGSGAGDLGEQAVDAGGMSVFTTEKTVKIDMGQLKGGFDVEYMY